MRLQSDGLTRTTFWLLAAMLTAMACCQGPTLRAQEYQQLFNGKDLSGWDGNPDLWSVEDGVITGRTAGPETLKYNQFLIWEGGEVKDFELVLEFRLEGSNNSGVQYRSRALPDVGQWVVGGYQADIHSKPEYTGMLYEEKGRGILAQRGTEVEISSDGKKAVESSSGKPEPIDLTEWHELKITARGRTVTHQIDGKTTIRITDHQQDAARLSGLIALQVHRGPAMKAQFRKIRLRKFPAQDATKPKPKPRARNKSAQVRPEGVQPAWVWLQQEGRPVERLFLRKEITIRGAVAAARVYASCDNAMTLYVDGVKVLTHDDWSRPAFKNIVDLIEEETPGGVHVLAVEARNVGQDNPAGFLFRLDLESGWRDAWAHVSDSSWQVSTQAEPGWKERGFAARGWKPAQVIAPLGAAPWNSVTADVLAAAAPLREPEATPLSALKVAKGFQVELLYSVPKGVQGSWVNMCTDPKGRLIVSDQYGGLYRVTVPAVGERGEVRVEKIPVDIGEAQGLLWAFDSLYVVVNKGQKYEGGVYRVTDTDGDDVLDKLETLRSLTGRGEHGPHAVLLTEDGQGLYIVCGNGTELTEFDQSRVPQIWEEDNLLPRPYGRGFMKGKPAPGGYISRIDPDGQHWTLVATGFRNEFDAALNADGELFTFDADMEWDMNTPWYRPTRVCHVLSGAEFGWRNGGGKWPAYYPDSVPAVVDVGPGSPTGVCFGYGARFPGKYQRALFISDWSYGKLYATHLTPDGATYSGQLEEFVTGTPLPLTDVIVNEHDGAMYFAIGGRRVQSGLYRVTYVGDEATDPVDAQDSAGRELRATRRQLEALHLGDHPNAVEQAWPYLGHPDRSIRFAARIAIEHRPVDEWRQRALDESGTTAKITALLALVRQYPQMHEGSGPELDSPPPEYPAPRSPHADLQQQVLISIAQLDWQNLSVQHQLDLVRVVSLTFLRLGPPNEEVRLRIGQVISAVFPTRKRDLDAELAALLVYVQAPTAAEEILAELEAAPTQEAQMNYAKSLRHLRAGWTPEHRRRFLSWLRKATGYRGGASFTLFVKSIFDDTLANMDAEEKEQAGELAEWKPETTGAVVRAIDRPFVKEWTMESVLPLLQQGLHDRDFDRGRRLFGELNCFACHRFANEGGAVGPDLTALSGRFSQRDILESVLEPSKQISDQYQAVTVVTVDGKVVTGRIVNLAGDSIRINTNMLDPNAQVGIDRKQIDEMAPSPISMMPKGLLNSLNEQEILDLMAFLLSRGDRSHAMFKN